MTDAQLLVEEKVQRYLAIINQSLNNIRKLEGNNTDFINIQNAFQQAFEISIISKELKMLEMEQYGII